MKKLFLRCGAVRLAFISFIIFPLLAIPLLGHAKRLSNGKRKAVLRQPNANKDAAATEITAVGESDATAPEYRRNNHEVDHSIVKATVYSDRALVVRKALAKTGSGPTWIHFGFLPTNLDKSSLKIRTLGDYPGQISQVVLEESFENVGLAPDTRKQINELKTRYAALLEQQQQRRGVEQAREFVASMPYEAPFKREPAAQISRTFNVRVETLETSLRTLKEQDSRMAAQLVELKEKERVLQEQIATLVKNLEHVTSLSEQRWVLHGYFLLDRPSPETVPIELSYFIPNAKWYPTYDIRAQLNRNSGTADVTLVTAALVEQKTTESWKNVTLTFSTLDPIALWLPKFTRWILKETRIAEEVSAPANVSLSDNALREAKPMVKMAAKHQSAEAPSRQQQQLERRRSEEPSNGALDKQVRLGTDSEDLAASESESVVAAPQELGNAEGAPMGKSASHLSQFRAEVGDSMALISAAPQLQKLEQMYPFLSKVEQTLKKFEKERQFRTASTEQSGEYRAKTEYADSSLPAVLAKGRVMELTAPLPVTIESDNEAFKTPLTTSQFQGRLQYYSVPKMDTRVFLKAKVLNPTQLPILAGTAHVFMDNDLVSETTLPTVDPKSSFSVNLGVDPNIETKRVVSKKSEKTGVITKQHVTGVRVALQLVNHHPFPVEMEILDNYPQSPNDKLEVKLLDFSTAPIEKEEGLLKWKLTLAPHEEKTISFNYQVTHPEDALVSEFN